MSNCLVCQSKNRNISPFKEYFDDFERLVYQYLENRDVVSIFYTENFEDLNEYIFEKRGASNIFDDTSLGMFNELGIMIVLKGNILDDLFTFLHEYRHFIQFCEKKFDFSLDSSDVFRYYINNSVLETDANHFAYTELQKGFFNDL